ncbi:radical SAM protein [Clostridioides difficile]|nr:radical SAM protein [Clostridioides difficile]
MLNTDNTIELDYKNKIIKHKNNMHFIYDKISKRKIFVSDEVLNYIVSAEKLKLDESSFINCFENKDDKIYIRELMVMLKKVGFIKNENYNIELSKINNLNFRSVHLLLTNRCNLKCKHCSSNCEPDGEDTLGTDEIKNIILNLKETNPKRIVFSGGEPLLRHDFEEIIRYAKTLLKNTKFSLSTNGTLINENNVVMIKELFNCVDISVDGIDEDSCSKVRGNGVFNKVIKSVYLLKKNGVNDISLSMVFGVNNTNMKDEFIELNQKLGTTPIVRAFIPKGRGYQNKELFNNGDMKFPMLIANIYNDKTKTNSTRINTCACDAFENSLYIDANGDCYPCPSLNLDEYKIINLAKENIKIEYVKNRMGVLKREFLNVLDYKGTKCEICDINLFCWNCPADFINAKKNNEIDFWCDLTKENLEAIVWG